MNRSELTAFEVIIKARESFKANLSFMSAEVTYLEFVVGYIRDGVNKKLFSTDELSAIGSLFRPKSNRCASLVEEFIILCEQYAITCFIMKGRTDKERLESMFKALGERGWLSSFPLKDDDETHYKAKNGAVFCSEEQYKNIVNGNIENSIIFASLARDNKEYFKLITSFCSYGFVVEEKGRFIRNGYNPIQLASANSNEYLSKFEELGEEVLPDYDFNIEDEKPHKN